MTIRQKPKPYVFYHGGGCPDGFSAACVAHLKFGERAHYIGLSHTDPFPALRPGADVYFLDIAPKRETLEQVARVAAQVYILEHHETAKASLEGEWPAKVHIGFDMERSGAMLAWEHFYPDEELPISIKHVADRDLWKNELVGTDEFNAAITSYPRDFSVWNDLLFNRESYETLLGEGRALVRQQNQRIEDLLANSVRAAHHPVYGTFPAVNTNYFLSSDLGNALLKKYPNAPFSASYRDTGKGTREWSFRSEDGRRDVSEVASSMGGGGHRNSSGATEDHAFAWIGFFLTTYDDYLKNQVR